VGGIDTDLAADEIVDIVREMRQRVNVHQAAKGSRRANRKSRTNTTR
jgi:hypothetical protein